nr:unnamed protein product [Callosobruchus chinensis]
MYACGDEYTDSRVDIEATHMLDDSESDPFCDSGSSYKPSNSEDGSTSSSEDITISQEESEIETSEAQTIYLPGSEKEDREESTEMKTSYLCGRIKLNKKVKPNESRRVYTRVYYLPDERGCEVPVCKTFFKKVLQVSDGRLSRALKGLQENGVPSTDKRGRKDPYNKTNIARIEEVKAFIDRFPKYQSHYSRQKNPNKQYLAPTLNILIIYNLYKNEHEKSIQKKFQLIFHAPISDSCKTCDTLEQKVKYESDTIEGRRLEIERDVHLRKAEAARVSMKSDAELAKDDSNDTTVIAFDLMSTLPTPHLSTGVCYYKRQLWTYCFNIHNLSTGDSYMYVWDELKASRGPAEIGTCIIHFMQTYVKTSQVIMYSDQCGGQNCNIKLALICNHIIQSKKTTVHSIDHKFLVSGHTYLACDRDFGLIEKSKKSFNEIFVPSDWIKVIINARKKNPFRVIKLNHKDFVSTETLQKNIVNRKETIRGRSVNWLKFQWLRYQLENPNQIFFKETLNRDFAEFEVIELKKRGTVEIHDLPLLYPNGRHIEILKYQNLVELLPYIPPILHEFYKNLKVKNAENAENTVNIDDAMALYDLAEFGVRSSNQGKGKAPIGKKRPIKKAAPASETHK